VIAEALAKQILETQREYGRIENCRDILKITLEAITGYRGTMLHKFNKAGLAKN
jgi:hypothetical protein